jgi:hypothetical protein
LRGRRRGHLRRWRPRLSNQSQSKIKSEEGTKKSLVVVERGQCR